MKQFVIGSASVRGEKAVVRGKDFHYLIRVRRYRIGSRFPAVDETGRRYEAAVTVISPDECVLTLTAAGDVPGGEKPETELVLIQCLPKAKGCLSGGAGGEPLLYFPSRRAGGSRKSTAVAAYRPRSGSAKRQRGRHNR